MIVEEEELVIPEADFLKDPLHIVRSGLNRRTSPDGAPIRAAIIRGPKGLRLEVGLLRGTGDRAVASISAFRRRGSHDARTFNAVMMIPTGIGAEIGGHAGDGCPAAQLLASACDKLILHPNVVNASDINELPTNSLYVEGSVLTRLMMGTVGLAPTRANRLLVILNSHRDGVILDSAINAVNAARASAGISIPNVVVVRDELRLFARHTAGGRAAGRVESLETICKVLDEAKGSYDAVAFSSVIDVPFEFHAGYFKAQGAMVNPWGGVEAMFTHAVSSMFNVPSAHSPMFESQDIANLDVGIVDARMAAEAVSVTFLHCILKGLSRSPRILQWDEVTVADHVIGAEAIGALVQPDGCIGLPTLAALEQRIPVIAVKENRTIMRNDLGSLPWNEGQFWRVENYWEAAGLLLAMRNGIDPNMTRRPLGQTRLLAPRQREVERAGVTPRIPHS